MCDVKPLEGKELVSERGFVVQSLHRFKTNKKKLHPSFWCQDVIRDGL